MSIRRDKNGKLTVEYVAWKAMKARCYSKTNSNLSYQKKGIIVSNIWKSSFEEFLKDMGKCPSERHSLDRINNDDNYCKENCRWATFEQQARNRGDFNNLFTLNGKTQTLKEWSQELGIKYTNLHQRIFRSKIPFNDAILDDPFNRLIKYKGEEKTLKEWSIKLNIKYQTLIDRKSTNWSIEKMFETPIKM
jgi:hypothetical protein